jgi:Quinolinate synthase
MELNAEIKKATDKIYQKVYKTIPEIEWSIHAPYIYKINKLKKEKNAVILAHNYQTPEIYHGISDFSADSLALAVEAAKTKADIIVMCGVHFMAETAKLMSPEKKVLLPDLKAGCSLASSITGDDVRSLKKKYPGVPVVSYVNTSADVKAETDVCCTSANAVKIVKSLGVKKVIFLPDDFLAKYVASQTDVEIFLGKDM